MVKARSGPLGNFDLDESRDALPISEQIINALSSNAGKVLDLFRSWDENGDGVITRLEFRKAMRLLGLDVPLRAIDNIFAGWDKDGGGEISLPELTKILGAARTTSKNIEKLSTALRKGVYDKVADFFKRMDENSDGEVNQAEFCKAIKEIEVFRSTPREQIEAIFDTLDRDGDGTVSFEELNKVLRRDLTAEEIERKRREEEARLARELAARVELVDIASLRTTVAQKLKDNVGWLPRSEAPLPPSESGDLLTEAAAAALAALDADQSVPPRPLEAAAPEGAHLAVGRSSAPNLISGMKASSKTLDKELLHLQLRLRGTDVPPNRLLTVASMSRLGTAHSYYRGSSRAVTRHAQRHPLDAARPDSSVLAPDPIDILSIHRVRSFPPARRHARVLLPSKHGVELSVARRNYQRQSMESLQTSLAYAMRNTNSARSLTRSPARRGTLQQWMLPPLEGLDD